jgi:hypothetical protein
MNKIVPRHEVEVRGQFRALPSGKKFLYKLNRVLGGPQRIYGRFGVEDVSCLRSSTPYNNHYAYYQTFAASV